MSEVWRPAAISALLGALPRPTLVYLCDVRGLRVARANDACRSAIARSYRGQRDELLGALRKDDLVHLLRHTIRDGDDAFELPNPGGYSKRELVELAVIAFGRPCALALPFVRHGVESFAAAPAEIAPESLAADLAVASERLDAGWSRPRAVRALLAQLDLPVPESLSQHAFGELLDALEARGFEVAASDGTRLTSLHDAVTIDAELRVRHDALVSGPASHRSLPASPVGPAFTPARELSDYERASFRLELLTAHDGPAAISEAAIAACVDRAAVGLAIEAPERALLQRVAMALASAPRSPCVSLHRLLGRIDADDLGILVREYCALHADLDATSLLREHWAALSLLPTSPT